ncbi:IS4 family transposase [Ramlibacter sp. USB13]|uniref:IS4 family transposase n=1 Tax=Ramlibacter cellulosilyticus TaxID=2764187 RepID=A0A923MWI6_9BURK|nr:IS4 family transposase [Ramlibacter cellulosilyticus]MBC5786406.1 IS4 family transposase [Ramlibacter cellulosilyticus]
MLKGQLVFAQLTAHLPRPAFNECVALYAGRYPTLTFSYWDQLLCMMFAQLTSRTSLRDITTCLRSHSSKLYFAGFRGSIARSTLADANERRDSRAFERFTLHLIDIARALYARESLGVQLAQSVYAIDASTIDLCLSLFSWAPAANARAGVKLHTLLDLRGNIPSVIRITSALVSDASFLDHLRLEAGSFYVMDRGYLHFQRLARFSDAAAFFVIRSKNKIHHKVIADQPSDMAAGVLCDQSILLTGRYTRLGYPVPLRRIEFHDAQRDRTLIFLTNNFDLQPLQIAQLYKSRWQVELFFKWIKQHLRIKAFVGTSANAVKTQIWTAIATYVLVAIIKKRLNVQASLHAMLQVLSLNLFEKVPLERLLSEVSLYDESDGSPAQLPLL